MANEVEPDQYGTELDHIKIETDLVKHVSILSSGSIVLLGTFFDRLPKPLQAREFLIAAVIGFCACVFLSVWFLLVVGIGRNWKRGKPAALDEIQATISSALAGIAFLGGMAALGDFVVRNILHLS